MLRHKKHASAFIAFLMAFALIFTSSGIGSLTFTKADDTQTIYYNGESITLSEHALYVNQNLASSSGYSYKTLQEAVANAIILSRMYIGLTIILRQKIVIRMIL